MIVGVLYLIYNISQFEATVINTEGIKVESFDVILFITLGWQRFNRSIIIGYICANALTNSFSQMKGSLYILISSFIIPD